MIQGAFHIFTSALSFLKELDCGPRCALCSSVEQWFQTDLPDYHLLGQMGVKVPPLGRLGDSEKR